MSSFKPTINYFILFFCFLALQVAYPQDNSSLSPIDFAETLLDISNYENDLSMKYLAAIFGNIPQLADYGIPQFSGAINIMNNLMPLYNLGMLALLFSYVSFFSVHAVLGTTKDNRGFLEKINFWVVTRPVIGIIMLMPTTSGYSLMQILILLVVSKGVALADSLWGMALIVTDTSSSLQMGQEDTVDIQEILASSTYAVEPLVANAICIAKNANNNYRFGRCSNNISDQNYCWGKATSNGVGRDCGHVDFGEFGQETDEALRVIVRSNYLSVIDGLNANFANYTGSAPDDCQTMTTSECISYKNAYIYAVTQMYSSIYSAVQVDRFTSELTQEESVTGGTVFELSTDGKAAQQRGWLASAGYVNKLLGKPSKSNWNHISNDSYTLSTVEYDGNDRLFINLSPTNYSYDFSTYLGASQIDWSQALMMSGNQSFNTYLKRSLDLLHNYWIKGVLGAYSTKADVKKVYKKMDNPDTSGDSATIDLGGDGNNYDNSVGTCAIKDANFPGICIDPVGPYLEKLFNLILQIIFGIKVFKINKIEDSSFLDATNSIDGTSVKTAFENMKYNTVCLSELNAFTEVYNGEKTLDTLDIRSDTDYMNYFYASHCYAGYGLFAYFKPGTNENPVQNLRNMGVMFMQAAGFFWEGSAQESIKIFHQLAKAYTSALIVLNTLTAVVSGILYALADYWGTGGVQTQGIARQFMTAAMSVHALGSISDDMLKITLQMSLQLANIMVPYANMIAGVIFSTGAILGIYVSFLPAILIVTAAVGWLMLVFEAVLAAPLIAIGITHPEGHDLLGRADQFIMLMVATFTRPAAIMFGVIVALLLTQIAIKLVNISYIISMSNFMAVFAGLEALIPGLNGHVLSIIQTGAATLGSVVYLYLVMGIVYLCFTCVYTIPDRFMKWVGLPAETSMAGKLAKQLKSQLSAQADKAQSSVSQSVSFRAESKSISPSLVRGLAGQGKEGSKEDSK